jgi:serine/threonine protein kinase
MCGVFFVFATCADQCIAFSSELYTLIIVTAKLEVTKADCFFKQLMHSVECAHKIGVAQRDLKPKNLLLTADGALKITMRMAI